MSTSSLLSTATLKGLFFVSLVSYGATHRYVLDTKGWVTLPKLRRFCMSAPPLAEGMKSDCRIITLQTVKEGFVTFQQVKLAQIKLPGKSCDSLSDIYLFWVNSGWSSCSFGRKNRMTSAECDTVDSHCSRLEQYFSRLFSRSTDLLRPFDGKVLFTFLAEKQKQKWAKPDKSSRMATSIFFKTM